MVTWPPQIDDFDDVINTWTANFAQNLLQNEASWDEDMKLKWLISKKYPVESLKFSNKSKFISSAIWRFSYTYKPAFKEFPKWLLIDSYGSFKIRWKWMLLILGGITNYKCWKILLACYNYYNYVPCFQAHTNYFSPQDDYNILCNNNFKLQLGNNVNFKWMLN